MRLELRREQSSERSTIGALLVDGAFECWTLEDPIRADGVKIKALTAIPAGTYEIAVTYSTRFGRLLPLLLDVENFSGIRIHPGNTPDHTEGCILVGEERYPDAIGRSRAAFDALFVKLEAAYRAGQRITIAITSPTL